MHPVDPLLEILGLSAIWQRREPAGGPMASSPAPAAALSDAFAGVQDDVPGETPGAPGEAPAGALHGATAISSPTAQAAAAAAADVSTAPDAASVAADSAEDDIASLDIDALRQRVTHCTRCRLCETRTKAVFGVGDPGADWMMIGEGPGATEDQVGEPFVGQAGKLLDNMLRAVDLNRASGVFITNVVKCRPPGNRDPLPDEIAACAPYLRRQITLVQPKVLLALGRFAAQSLLQTQTKIGALRGTVHQHEGVPVIATYHPAYLLRTMTDKAKAWQDLCLARDTLRARLAAQSSTPAPPA